MKRAFGFTLTEMLFVVLIAAGILVFAVPSYKRAKERSAYEAATGLLVKLGSAVQTFEKDLQLKGSSLTAAEGTAIELDKSKLNSTSLSSDVTLNAAYFQNTTTTSQKLGMLIPAKYLDDFPAAGSPQLGGYKFYWLAGSKAICGQNISAKVYMVAQDVSIANGCYCGAVYEEDGTIKRLSGTNCTK